MTRSVVRPSGRPTNDDALPLDPALVRELTADVVATGEPVTTIAPFTGGPLATLPQSTASDVTDAFIAAREAQREWAATPVRRRIKPFLRLYDLMLSRQHEVLDLIQWETGKARLHAFEELLDAATSTLYYARHAERLLRPRRRAGALPILTRTVETPLPKGVVGTITPWNYPFALAMDVVPALLAGNAVVHKPDTQTALSSLWPRALLVELGLPAALWQVVLGNPVDVGAPMIEHADYIGFTGSTAAGRAIAEQAARRLIGCSLELGGKNPMLVLADADLDKTVQAAVRACFSSAGQLCVSMERIYVHESVHSEFVARFAERTRQLRLGSELDFTADVGSLTSEKQLRNVAAAVDAARQGGATVVTGGRPRPDMGPFFYEPTVLTDVTPDIPLCREETFGPVVSVYPFADEDEAVRAANDTQYGLNASIFSRDVKRARRLAARVQAGTVNINEGYASAYASQGGPMGGMKESGLGRRHGSAGLLKYTEPQSVASQHVLGFDPAFGLSQQRHAALFTLSLKALKALRIR
ncbi:MAG TPA: succinic semialdehyde dehydrogenase [Pseudonocardiaceae bacterium]|jgi:succinate-semialdehyde dehydrogenase/glutarate-semialdehyde dehydrogenase|nr:succinic semialdehyde dehydrogenase [Pseudonocardiaceae bacterium]